MIKVDVRTDFDAVIRSLKDYQSQIPFATALALTRTAQDVAQAERVELQAKIDRPTRFTLNSLYVKPATKARLESEVWLKYGRTADHYLLPLIVGAARPAKRFEQRLRMTGYMRSDERAVPGEAMQLDAFGNMSRGQIVKILSQLRTAVVQGDFSNASQSRRSRAKRAQVAYFASKGTEGQRSGFFGRKKRASYQQHLPRGIWERRVHAWGTSVRPVLLFVGRAKYEARVDFFGVARRTISQQFPIRFAEAARIAISTAR